MPLKKCSPNDKKCIGSNIAKLIREGKRKDVAVAIAFNSAKRKKKR